VRHSELVTIVRVPPAAQYHTLSLAYVLLHNTIHDQDSRFFAIPELIEVDVWVWW